MYVCVYVLEIKAVFHAQLLHTQLKPLRGFYFLVVLSFEKLQ